MPLNEDVKKKVAKKIEEYEGRTNHMYLDPKGKVTIGVGHLIVNKAAVGSIILCITKNNVPSQIASMKEKEDEYDSILRQPTSHIASWYKRHTKLIMKKEDIESLLDNHILSFYQELTGIYQKSKGYHEDFDNFPENVQLALFDMIFNLGANQITKEFPGFNKALKACDWQTAAQESNRPDVNSARNNYVKQLLTSTK